MARAQICDFAAQQKQAHAPTYGAALRFCRAAKTGTRAYLWCRPDLFHNLPSWNPPIAADSAGWGFDSQILRHGRGWKASF
ncbi:MAG: hypothetical protein GDA40_07385 [Rhodobacteraceae bacterium]|nr:hypothetical protein [Paracoccaceae bacterium]